MSSFPVAQQSASLPLMTTAGTRLLAASGFEAGTAQIPRDRTASPLCAHRTSGQRLLRPVASVRSGRRCTAFHTEGAGERL